MVPLRCVKSRVIKYSVTKTWRLEKPTPELMNASFVKLFVLLTESENVPLLSMFGVLVFGANASLRVLIIRS
jgi:hypothetical protein